MNNPDPIFRSLRAPMGFWLPAVLLLPVVIIGCGDKQTKGIAANIVADFNNDGVGDNDTYPDSFLTPDTITVGIKSVKLIKADETDTSYTIFDTGDSTNPDVLDLTTNVQQIDVRSVYPDGCPCDYSKVQIELTFIEIVVPTYDGDSLRNRKFRFYTLDLLDPALGVPIQAGDVLVSDNFQTPQFSWIDTDQGTFTPITSSRPSFPLQVPYSLFPDDVYTSTSIIDLPEFLKIPDKPKGLYNITLTVHAGNLFFYDETDSLPPESTRFDRFTDGRLNANEPDSHYYPTYPSITAAAE
jgi:hypothetical protein